MKKCSALKKNETKIFFSYDFKAIESKKVSIGIEGYRNA